MMSGRKLKTNKKRNDEAQTCQAQTIGNDECQVVGSENDFTRGFMLHPAAPSTSTERNKNNTRSEETSDIQTEPNNSSSSFNGGTWNSNKENETNSTEDSSDLIMFYCQLCQQEVDEDGAHQQPQIQYGLDELEAHLASEHFNCLPYECEQCQFAKFPTEYAIMKHNEQDHGNRQYSFRCRITATIKKQRAQVRDYLLLVTGNSLLGTTAHQHANLSHTNSLNQRNQGISGDGTTKKQGQPQLMARVKNELVEHNELFGQQHQQRKKRTTNVGGGGGVTEEDEVPSVETGNGNNEEMLDATSLLEQIQAACAQNMHQQGNRGKRTAGGGSFGGTMEIREGGELPASLLMAGNHRNSEEDEEEELRRQEADVVEILKAAAAAASQVNGGNQQQQHLEIGKRNSIGSSNNNNSPYSLRPNRFSPYIFLQRHQQKNWHNQQQDEGYSKCYAGAFGVQRTNGVGTGAAGINNNRSRVGYGVPANRNSAGGGVSLQFMGNRRAAIVQRIPCKKCHELVNSTGGCLMHHVNTRHLRLPLFQCKQCSKDFYEVSNTRIHKHMRIHHGGDISNLISNYAKYSHALHAGRDDCFGSREERLRAARGETTQKLHVLPKTDFNTSNNSNNVSASSNACDTVRAVFQKSQAQQQSIEIDGDTSPTLSGPFQSYTTNNGNSQECDDQNDADEIQDVEDVSVIQQQDVDDGDYQQEDGVEDDELPVEQSAGAGEEVAEEYEEADVPPTESNTLENRAGMNKRANGTNNANNNNNLGPGTSKQQAGFPPSMMGMTSSSSPSSVGAGSSGYQPPAAENHQRQIMMLQMLGPEEKVPCKMCGEMVLNKMLNRLNHVNVRHLHLPLHQCRLCNKSFTSYSRSGCYSHVQFAHRADLESGQFSQNIEEHIIYMKAQYSEQLMEAATEYFD